jgi:hypothetical protein
MKQYHDLLERILSDGAENGDRTGTGTLSVFGHQMRFDLGASFPMLTTKRLPLKAIVCELLWFLAGDTFRHLSRRFVRAARASRQRTGHVITIPFETAPAGARCHIFSIVKYDLMNVRSFWTAAYVVVPMC